MACIIPHLRQFLRSFLACSAMLRIDVDRDLLLDLLHEAECDLEVLLYERLLLRP